MVMQILKTIVNLATVATGVVSLFWPIKVQEFTGLTASGGRGITEIRVILGALFIALGVASQVYNAPQTYGMLGIMYLSLAVVRTISIIIDQSATSSNLISVVVELVFGLILIF